METQTSENNEIKKSWYQKNRRTIFDIISYGFFAFMMVMVLLYYFQFRADMKEMKENPCKFCEDKYDLSCVDKSWLLPRENTNSIPEIKFNHSQLDIGIEG
jgi:hypothetical protein